VNANFHAFLTPVETAHSRPARTFPLKPAPGDNPKIRTQEEMDMTFHDSRGIALSTNNRASLDALERATTLNAGYYLDPLATIDAALQDDPQFAAGHCLRAALAVMSSERGALPMLEESVQAIEALGARANERERMHAAAARDWGRGDFEQALLRYGDIAVRYPRDLLAIQVSHVGDFFFGHSTMLRDRIAQVLPHWDREVPGYGFLLGMHAFGLEETGLYDRAEETGRRALDLNPRDPWAVHAVAHVLEMQGRIAEGIDWLEGRAPDWAPDNGLAYHNWWHLALHYLDLGDHAKVLDLYDTRIRPVQNPVSLEMLDASAMLWRLALRGVDVGARWEPLATCWAPLACDGFYAFNGVHATMALVGAGRWDQVDAVIDSLAAAAAGTGANAMMSREVGLPIARALAAFGRGQYATTIAELQRVRPYANRFGGSHAQRDIVQLTLTEAALRADDAALARALAAERTNVKPSSPFNWRLTARAYATAGLRTEAQHALDLAESAVIKHRPATGAARAAA
jgi:tetratricopeptide (TPR) repeat protein